MSEEQAEALLSIGIARYTHRGGEAVPIAVYLFFVFRRGQERGVPMHFDNRIDHCRIVEPLRPTGAGALKSVERYGQKKTGGTKPPERRRK